MPNTAVLVDKPTTARKRLGPYIPRLETEYGPYIKDENGRMVINHSLYFGDRRINVEEIRKGSENIVRYEGDFTRPSYILVVVPELVKASDDPSYSAKRKRILRALKRLGVGGTKDCPPHYLL